MMHWHDNMKPKQNISECPYSFSLWRLSPTLELCQAVYDYDVEVCNFNTRLTMKSKSVTLTHVSAQYANFIWWRQGSNHFNRQAQDAWCATRMQHVGFYRDKLGLLSTLPSTPSMSKTVNLTHVSAQYANFIWWRQGNNHFNRHEQECATCMRHVGFYRGKLGLLSTLNKPLMIYMQILYRLRTHFVFAVFSR